MKILNCELASLAPDESRSKNQTILHESFAMLDIPGQREDVTILTKKGRRMNRRTKLQMDIVRWSL